MPVSVLEPSDISTSASDFQQDGTAAAGSTGRVADAGHVHPIAAPALGYQIVTQVYNGPAGGGSFDVTASAPAGTKVVGGGFSLNGSYGGSYIQPAGNGPLADGSGWNVQGNFFGPDDPWVVTVYAICVNA